MHPGMMFWWKNARRGCGDGAAEAGAHGCGHHGAGHGHGEEPARSWHHEASGGEDFGGGGFGVRRPLRFLAYRLELDEKQVSELARVLGELKTERAQAEVDGRRSTGAFADAVSSGSFDEAKAAEAATLRVKSAERLRDAVVSALRRIHVLLNEEQRGKLAYLIRTGTVTI